MKMLKSSLAAIIVMIMGAFLAPAFATGGHSPPSSPPAVTAEQDQGQAQGQLQGQGQAQATDVDVSNDVTSVSKAASAAVSESAAESTSAADSDSEAVSSSGGNTLSTSTTYKQVRQPVNTAIAVAGVNTLQCVKTGAAGVQFIGVGASVSLPKKDKDCALENAADRAYARGNKAAGDKLTCLTSYMREVYPDQGECIAAQNELQAVKREDGTGTDYLTPEQADEERERRKAARPAGTK